MLNNISTVTGCLQVPVHLIVMDMSDKQAVATIVDQLPDSVKEIDILVNNAGLALGVSKVQDVDLEVCIGAYDVACVVASWKVWLTSAAKACLKRSTTTLLSPTTPDCIKISFKLVHVNPCTHVACPGCGQDDEYQRSRSHHHDKADRSGHDCSQPRAYLQYLVSGRP